MRKLLFIIITAFIFLLSCSSGEIKRNDNPVDNTPSVSTPNINTPGINTPVDNGTVVNVQPKEFNFKFVGYDVNIDDPSWDRRSYYKIYIDKIDAGRTTIGLESQKKTFESKISSNRHLLVVEKWVLDEKKGQYIKLNNIEQPKPGYLYFELPDDKAAVITLKNDPLNNKSEFELGFE
jgi:hypothetical protein